MAKKILFTFLCCIAAFSVHADAPIPSENEETADLIIHNRILAKVNEKTISVIDVMKRMDLFLQKHYPHLANSKMARFQFYSSQWRDYLSQMIDTELMLVDAEKLELKVSEAEVREEILNRFGPNTMPTLDKLGLTYEETRKMIQDEMIVQRMIWFRVNSKAINSVNSKDVKDAYNQYCIDNPEMQEWEYQVLSIRSGNRATSELLASKAFELMNKHLNLSSVTEQLTSPDEATTISVSQEIKADEKNVSEAHKQVLETLTTGSFSKPIAQVSRVDNSVVYRIFHLKKHSRKEVPSFEKMAEQLKEELLQEAASKENTQYITKLRDKLGYDEKHMIEILPSDFQPFVLR